MLKKILTLVSVIIIAAIFLTTVDLFLFPPKKIKRMIHKDIGSTHQIRKNVQKDIWTEERLHFRLFSESSKVRLKKAKKVSFEETLKNLQCWIQDKVDPKNQQIRYFTSASGKYYFPDHKFYAEKINLYFYQLPGKELPSNISEKEAYVSGIAKDISFYIFEKTPHFKAEHFRAHFNFENED